MLKLGVTSPYLHKYVVWESLIILLMPVHIAVQNSYPSVGGIPQKRDDRTETEDVWIEGVYISNVNRM